MTPYLSTLVQLVDFASGVNADLALAARLCLSYRGQSIRWRDFFFTVGSLAMTYERLSAGCSHPLLVIAPIDSVRDEYINLHHERVARGKAVTASLKNLAGIPLAQTVRRGALVAAYGTWQKRRAVPLSGGVTLLKMELELHRTEQLLVVTPPIG